TGREVPYLEFPMDKEIYKLHKPTQRDGIIFYAKVTIQGQKTEPKQEEHYKNLNAFLPIPTPNGG
ncbi:MAG: hypothetical protein EBX50_15345, partial [Chitinophagia bacterium]|nr:hypothetical protein [Chitinophagia bacterium]